LAAALTVEYFRSNVPKVQTAFVDLFGVMLRKEESTMITGATWVVGSALICSVLFVGYPHIAFIALSLFILGDAAAALVGLSIGRTKIGKKSLEGSLACFFLCLGLFYFIFPYVPGLLDVWGGKAPAAIIWTTAFVITLFELIPIKITQALTINDNLAVPIIAGLAIRGLEKILL
jgi:dolichol kinase